MLPLVEALGAGPVDVGAGDVVERGDGVMRTSAGRGALTAWTISLGSSAVQACHMA